jgi:hypothetical protein
MKTKLILLMLAAPLFMGSGCELSQTDRDHEAVERQQSQYAARQPVPSYDWSLERELVRKLYDMRNKKVATHSVWRSNYGTIEGHCPSMGYGIPYDTSLTNPWQGKHVGQGGVAVGQAEPNGIFASTNTSATWVICIGKGGLLHPVYVEAKVTVYPGQVDVDYETDRVEMNGKRHSIKMGSH